MAGSTPTMVEQRAYHIQTLASYCKAFDLCRGGTAVIIVSYVTIQYDCISFNFTALQ